MAPKQSTKAEGKAAAKRARATAVGRGSDRAAAGDAKAKSAKRAALKGARPHTSRKVRTDTTFHRPKTYRAARKPKYLRKAVPSAPRMDQFRTIVQPLNTESAMSASALRCRMVSSGRRSRSLDRRLLPSLGPPVS